MKKQSKRRVRPASEPALVRLSTNPEIGIAERMAIQAMRGGWADYQNSYRVLADCHGVLTLGLKRKKDDSLKGVLQLAMIALLNIYDRYGKTKKIGATGDELLAAIRDAKRTASLMHTEYGHEVVCIDPQRWKAIASVKGGA